MDHLFGSLKSLPSAAATVADSVSAFPAGVTEVISIICRAWVTNWPHLWPWLAFWFGLHFAVEYGAPALFGPAVYDFLGRDGKITSRRELAKDARTKVVACVQAIYVTIACAYGLMSPNEYARLRLDPYATSPLTFHLSFLGASYFAWDVVICILDRYPFEFHVHALLAFCSFSAAMVRRTGQRERRGQCVNNISVSTHSSFARSGITRPRVSVRSLFFRGPLSTYFACTHAEPIVHPLHGPCVSLL